MEGMKVAKRVLENCRGKELVMSFYVDTDRSKKTAKGTVIDVKNMGKKLQELLRSHPEPVRQRLNELYSQIACELESAVGDVPRSMAFFAAEDAGVVERIPLPTNVDMRIRVEPYPVVLPLLSALSPFRKSLIIVADTRRARFYMSENGRNPELLWEVDDEANRSKREREGIAPAGTERKLERRDEKFVSIHAREIVQKCRDLLAEYGLSAVSCGGNRPIAIEVVATLSESGIPAEVVEDSLEGLGGDALAAAVWKHDMKRFWERGEEITSAIRDDFSRKGMALAGWRPVLDAVAKGAVSQLVIDEIEERDGVICPACGRLDLDAKFCASCGAGMSPESDVVEAMARRVIEREGEVIVLGRPSLLWEVGGVGARLRFSV